MKNYYEIKIRKALNAAKNEINRFTDQFNAGLITVSELSERIHKIDIKHNILYFKILIKYRNCKQ